MRGTVRAMSSRVARPLALSTLAAGAAVALAASPAGAHTGASAGGLGNGVLHPITGPDHLLAMVAVGVVAIVAFEGRRRWLAPAAFVGAMALGGVAGMAGATFPGVELLIVASVIALGIAIAGAVEVGSRAGTVVLALLAVAGFAHGFAHGAEAPSAASPALYVAGFLVATVSLHLAGVGLGALVRDRAAARTAIGAATAAAGALLLLG